MLSQGILYQKKLETFIQSFMVCICRPQLFLSVTMIGKKFYMNCKSSVWQWFDQEDLFLSLRHLEDRVMSFLGLDNKVLGFSLGSQVLGFGFETKSSARILWTLINLFIVGSTYMDVGNYGFFAPLPVCPWLICPWLVCRLARSPPGWFTPCAWLIHPLACSPPSPVEYTGDSLLMLVFQFTERQQVSVASRHWLIVTSINIISDKLNNKWLQFTKSVIFGFIAAAELLYIAYI